MSKHLLTMIAVGLAVCLSGCTDEATDDAAEAPAEETAATTEAPAEDAAAAAPAAATEAANDAAAITMAKLDGVDVEAGCAKCAYKIAGVTECALAMKTGDKAYIVDGTDIISDDVGLCGANRPAKVTGEVTDDTHFMAKVFEFTDE